MTSKYDPGLLEEAAGAAGIGFNILFSPLTRPWYAYWGSTPAERTRPLPGDDIVPRPKLITTRAITIRAPVAAVWPWLMQLGQGRGGLYSYQRLENLAGCRIENVAEIRPELQDLAVGDKVRFGPDSYPFQVVRAVEPDHWLILGSPPDSEAVVFSWVFFLEPQSNGDTRLIVRNRGTYGPGKTDAIIWRVITDPVFFVMERRMLIGIRDRAEALARRGQAAVIKT